MALGSVSGCELVVQSATGCAWGSLSAWGSGLVWGSRLAWRSRWARVSAYESRLGLAGVSALELVPVLTWAWGLVWRCEWAWGLQQRQRD